LRSDRFRDRRTHRREREQQAQSTHVRAHL
jgi:hypothetical protein